MGIMEEKNYVKCVGFPMDDNPTWELYEDFYNRYYLNYDSVKTTIIPKRLHQIWLGGLFPEKYKRLRDTWIKLHPDWEYRCWDDFDAEDLDMVNKETYNKIDNLGAKSDILRYEILNKYGGIYFDTDFECVKPFDDLLYLDFIGGNGWNETPVIFNGLLGCAPGNKFIKSIIDGIHEKEVRPYYRLDKIMDFAGNYFITDLFAEYLKTTKDKAVMFPKDFFYPMPNTIREEVRNDTPENRKVVYSYIKDCTYCVHLWYVSWVNPVPSSYESEDKKIRCGCGEALVVQEDILKVCPKCRNQYKYNRVSRRSHRELMISRYDPTMNKHCSWVMMR